MKSKGSVFPSIEDFLTKLGLGIRAKLIVIFIVIKVIPLILIALVAWQQATKLGEDMQVRTQDLADKAVNELTVAGKLAVDDAVKALDSRGTQEIERLTTDTARRIAQFLYSRDDDLRFVASLPVDAKIYKSFIENKTRAVVKQGTWVLSEDGKKWVSTTPTSTAKNIEVSNEQNANFYNYRKPDVLETEPKPLYHEITFVDLNGQEKIKITTSDLMDSALKNVSDRKNTFVKAETYFEELKKLKPGEIYVSDVIGAYVGSPIIGIYTPENAKKRNIPYEPEKAAFAGPENPNGKRFKGIVRWAMPVTVNKAIIGYITLALNHDHIMGIVNHVTPKPERYTELSDAIEGDYVFIWDHKGRNIAHPRHHSITGYDPETGDPQVPLLEDRIYNDWQASGKAYADFIKDVPTFVDQRRERKLAVPLVKQGNVGLDCRYLNSAPQCEGWYDVTKDGGSGSFQILWSGLWKLTTAAAIPYYTGQYGKTKRGFAVVTATSGIENFHAPAIDTEKEIQKIIANTDKDLDTVVGETFKTITKSLWDTAISLSASTLVMTLLVIFVAIWMASAMTEKITYLIAGITRFRNGERQFRFNAQVKDELGVLADSLDDLSKSIEDSVKGPATITDLDGRVVYTNKKALELLDMPIEQVMGRMYIDVSVFDEDNNPISAFQNKREQPITLFVPTQTYYKSNTNYLTNKDDENVGYLIVLENVTELIQEQERIERERALLDTVISSSPDLIWYQDADEVFLSVNPRFADSLGKSVDEVLGKKLSDVMPKVVYEANNANNQEAIRSASPLHTEERITFADGHVEIVDVVRMPLFSADNKLRGLLGVARDVSLRVNVEKELRHTQRELIDAVADAVRASASKSEFLARMSHEIRTPMNAIIGMTNLAKRKLDESQYTKMDLEPNISQIDASSLHLLGLINDILDISKIEAGKIELAEENFSLAKVINEVTNIVQPRCDAKKILFKVLCDTIDCEEFISDGLRLRQILLNILGNAVKFTAEEGEIFFNVKQKERKNGKTLIYFTIKDTGNGIAQSAKDNIFNPFAKGSRHVRRNYGGTGLGLSISQSIAQLMGSKIEVQSVEGQGSTFSFEVWLKECTPIEEVAQSTDEDNIPTGKRIMLVDDVDINRIIAAELLSPFEFIIEEASDGTEAVEKFAASPLHHYDLIYMDIQMPKMDGYEATRSIRNLDREDAKSVSIVAMSANAFKDDIDEAINSGMNAHIAKPIDMQKLIDSLKTYLSPNK